MHMGGHFARKGTPLGQPRIHLQIETRLSVRIASREEFMQLQGTGFQLSLDKRNHPTWLLLFVQLHLRLQRAYGRPQLARRH